MDPVDAIWEAHEPGPSRILPDGCVDLVERDGQVVVIGPMSVGRLVEVAGPLRGVRFRPGGFLGWSGVSPSELVDEVVPVDDLFPKASLGTLQALVEHARRTRPDPRILTVVRQIQKDPKARVHVLAGALGWTDRHLRRRLVEETGFSPRKLARIFRLQRFVGRLHEPVDLGELAYTCGYADQAHLSRDVRQLTGVPPSVLRRTSGTFKPPH